MSAPSSNVLAFNAACRKMRDTKTPPYCVNGIYFYVRRKIPRRRAAEIRSEIEGDYKCRACGKRFLFLASLFGPKNKSVFNIAPFSATETNLVGGLASRLRGYCDEFASGQICGIYVLSDIDVNNIGNFDVESGIGPNGVAFHHYCAAAPDFCNGQKNVLGNYLSRVFDLYIVQEIAVDAFNKLCRLYSSGCSGFYIIHNILSEEAWGVAFIPALKWLTKLNNNLVEPYYRSVSRYDRLMLRSHIDGVPVEVHLLDAIVSAGILIYDNDVTIPTFHTALRLIDILEKLQYNRMKAHNIVKVAILGPQT